MSTDKQIEIISRLALEPAENITPEFRAKLESEALALEAELHKR